jgi:hypothetical protein
MTGARPDFGVLLNLCCKRGIEMIDWNLYPEESEYARLWRINYARE